MLQSILSLAGISHASTLRGQASLICWTFKDPNILDTKSNQHFSDESDARKVLATYTTHLRLKTEAALGEVRAGAALGEGSKFWGSSS